MGRALSRLDNIASSGTPDDSDKYVEYTKHLGAATLVELEYPAVTVSNNPLVLTYGGSGTYGGFDRFGRIVGQKWQIAGGATKDRYTYPAALSGDRNSNRLYRKNELPASHGELYHANGASANTQRPHVVASPRCPFATRPAELFGGDSDIRQFQRPVRI